MKRSVIALTALVLAMAFGSVQYRWDPTAISAQPCSEANCAQVTSWLPAATTASNESEANPLDQTWVAFPAPSTSADRLVHATVYDPVGDKIYMIGGNPAGQQGTYLTLCQQFDPKTNTWTNMAPMPDARGWIQGVYVRGKIYVVAGHTNAGTTSNTNYCYDIASNSWSTLAPLTRSTLAYQAGAWRDSLVYIIGGTTAGAGGGETGVNVYNPFTNTWAAATSLPEHGDMGSAVIVGDTIYITNAYNRASNAVWANGRKGAINPASPTTITWSNMPARPYTSLCSGSAALQGRVYCIGGFAGGSAVTGRAWYYDIATGTITEMTALPNPPYTSGLARCHFAVGREGGGELYVVAGDANGDWAVPNNYYYRMQFTSPNDVGVSQIIVPDTLTAPGAVTPKLLVKNYGTLAQADFLLGCWIDSAGIRVYEQTGFLNGTLAPGATDTVTFGFPWFAINGIYNLTAFTSLDNDDRRSNDTLRRRVRVPGVGIEEQWIPGPQEVSYSIRPTVGNGIVYVSYTLSGSARVNLGIYDAAGNLVRTLQDGQARPGATTCIWDRRADDGKLVARGTYFYRLTVNNRLFSGKSVVLD